METISFEVAATDLTAKPDGYRKIRVEVDGVELSDLVDAIDDNEAVLNIIGEENISEWAYANEKLFTLFDCFTCQELADYLETQGWKAEPGNGEHL